MIRIFQCEQSYEHTPSGILNFLIKNKEIEIEYTQAKNSNQVSEWINSINKFDIIIFPFYEDPFYIGKDIISKIRKLNYNNKIYACGPLAIYYPEEIIEYFGVDDIIINNELPFVTFIDYKNGNYNNSSIFKQNEMHVDVPFKLELKVLHVIAVPYPSCSNKCSFCIRRDKFSLSHLKCYSHKMDIDRIVRIIKENTDNQREIVAIHVDNLFNQYSLNEIQELFDKIDSLENKIKKIILWSCVSDILKNKEFIKNIKKDFLVQWYVGIESFCKVALDRYKKPFYDQNIEFYNLIQDDYFVKTNNVFDMLFINFDPWITPEEIKTNIEFSMNFNKKSAKCSRSSYFVGFSQRFWRPIKNTPLYDKAIEENLLIKKKMSIIGTFVADYEEYITLKHLPWKFKNKRSQEIFVFMCELKDYYYKNIIKNTKRLDLVNNSNDKRKQCVACSGSKRVFNDEFIELEKMILQWISNKKLCSKKDIRKKFSELKDKILGYKY